MPESVAKVAEESYQAVIIDPIELALHPQDIPDMFSPEMPEAPETPDPVAEASGIGAMQANERALRDRKGLATTKVVQNSLLKQRKRSSFGGSAV